MPSSLGRVLVVEDEPRVGAMLREGLVELGYIVEVAVQGAEALQLMPVFEPDVVLLDLLMPEMSGVEVLAHLRRDRPTLRVVIMSGNEDVEVARATLRRRSRCRTEPSPRLRRGAGGALTRWRWAASSSSTTASAVRLAARFRACRRTVRLSGSWTS